jgi:hypothetical protein
MELIVWDGLVFGTRWLLYLGAAAAIGAVFISLFLMSDFLGCPAWIYKADKAYKADCQLLRW